MNVPMFRSRRRFLQFGFWTTCLLSLGRLFAKSEVSDAAFEDCLQAWVEVLIPSDGLSPGAGQLNVHLDLIEEVKQQAVFRRLLWEGVAWLEGEAKAAHGVAFAKLTEAQAETIAAKAASMGASTLPRGFFNYSFHICKGVYYAKPEAWGGLGIERPPQPFGYMDYTEEVP